MYNYINLMRKLYIRLDNPSRPDRTNTGTASIFDHTLEFDLRERFPLLPFREIDWNNVVTELVWFLRGETNIAFLKEHGCEWWSNQCSTSGDVGPMYGAQWRGYVKSNCEKTPDQIAIAVDNLINDPYGRRNVVDSWEASAIPGNNCDYDENVKQGKMALAPCHHMFQLYVNQAHGKSYLDLKFHMRSSDAFLGLPANIASYALLVHILAGLTGLLPGRLIYNGGDVHLYANHDRACGALIDQYHDMVNEVLDNRKQSGMGRVTLIETIAESLCPTYELPKEFFDLVSKETLDFKHPDLVKVLASGLKDYKPGKGIRARMAR